MLLLPFLGLAAVHPAVRSWPLLAGLESATLDWRYRVRGERVPQASVAIVAIDDATVRVHGGWPLRRSVLAAAIRHLSRVGARVVALDLILADPGRDPAEDTALAAALAQAGTAVLGVALRYDPRSAVDGGPSPAAELGGQSITLVRRPDAPALPEPLEALVPVARLRNAAAGLGHVNVVLGRTGGLRQLYPILLVGGLALPALSVTAVRLFEGVPRDAVQAVLPSHLRLGDLVRRLDPSGRWSLNFFGPAGTFPTYSMRDLLAGTVPDGALTGRIVWIGATATGAGDAFVTPFDPALPGVEAFATASANLLADGFLERDAATTLAEMAAVVLVGGGTLLIALTAPAGLALLLTPLPVLLWLGATVLAFAAGSIWLNLTVPALAGLAAAAGVGAWRFFLSERRRRRLVAYLPGPLAEALASADRPGFAERNQTASVLFADLVGFTSRSEAETPDDTAALLRQVHGLLEEAAARHGGYVDSFSGDGAMLVFGVPEPGPDDAARALACARDLLACGDEAGLTLRAGLHAGAVQVARLGGRQHRQLSLAGDSVNLASRLMEVAKQHGVRLAVSEPAAAQVRAAGQAALLAGLEHRPDQDIRGRRGVVDVWLDRRADPA